MTNIADTSVKIQTTSELTPSTPCWFGEVVVISSYLRKHGILSKINEQVRFTRKRFGCYELIDFLAVLFGYAISGERTLEGFYKSLQPFAIPFMALFERDQLPSRSALSRFLTALTEAPIEALSTLFLDDLLARPLTHDKQTGGLVDRAGNNWIVFDIDGTREAARQRALPQTDDLPPPSRRLDDVCAPEERLHLPPRSISAASRKSVGAQSLRLPPDPGGTGGNPLPRDRGHASGFEEKESGRRHTRRSGLRTVLHQPAATRLHGLRCGRIVSASWRL